MADAHNGVMRGYDADDDSERYKCPSCGRLYSLRPRPGVRPVCDIDDTELKKLPNEAGS
jgi:hypothetical protein